MRRIRSFFGRIFLLFLFITVCILLIKIKVNGTVTVLSLHDYKYFLPVLLLLPLSHLIWGKMVSQTYSLDSFEFHKWEKRLSSYGAMAIVNEPLKKVYKVPFSKVLVPAHITLEWHPTSVVVTAPKRVFYDFNDI